MAHTFNANLAARILAGALAVFREELHLATRVVKDFEGAAAKLGDTVVVAKPVAASVSNVTPAATPPAVSDISIQSVAITINQWKKATPFYLTEKEATIYQASALVPMQVAEQARALAYQLNADLFALYKGVSGYAGTAGVNPFANSVDPAADVRAELNTQRCPPGNRCLCIGPEEEASALKLSQFKTMLNAGDSNPFRKGDLGWLYGMQLMRDRQRPTHTAGTGAAFQVNNAAGYAIGDTAITVDTGNGTILDGDIITFAGHARTYAVQSFANNIVTLYKGLEATVADDEAITLKANHKVNLACDPAAFGLVMRLPPSEIEGAPTYGEAIAMVDPETQIPMKLTVLPGYHCTQWELSVLYGVALLDERRAARLAG